SRTKSLGRTLNSSHDQNCLALVDVKDFDPKDVVVTVKDKKVIVFAERRDECNTSGKKTCNYRRLMKEFNLPPGVRENKVTFSL
ncbi:ODFP1 protein, partial [Pitta sordida]|nr:ODFP1 protein [Pitta sordida]